MGCSSILAGDFLLHKGSEEAHLAALGQVCQHTGGAQAFQHGAGHTGGLLELLRGDILLPVDGGTLQRGGGSAAHAFQGTEGQAHLAILHDILVAPALAQLDGQERIPAGELFLSKQISGL